MNFAWILLETVYKLKCAHLSRLFFQGDPRILK